MQPTIKPAEPVVPGWQRMRSPLLWGVVGFNGQRWYHRATRIAVISEIRPANGHAGANGKLGYRLSISKSDPTRDGKGMRCTTMEAMDAVCQFGLIDAKEDAPFHTGIARIFSARARSVRQPPRVP